MSSDSESDKEWTVSEELVEVREQKSAGDTTLDFDGLLRPPLKLHEDLTNGCGGQLWPAGMVLAQYCLRVLRDQLVNKTILELGAGAGIVGLAVARWLHDQGPAFYQQTFVNMTDQQAMLDLMRRNIQLNELPTSLIQGNILDWGVETTAIEHAPDIILAADCVYFEPAFPLLMQELHRLMGAKTICLFCMKKRRKADMRFVRELKKAFNVQDVEDDPDKVNWSRQGLFLYKVTRRQKLYDS